MSFTVDLADHVLGALAPHQLPDVCLRALTAGLESTSLAALAGMTAASYDRWEAEALWAAALAELGVVLPGEEEAVALVIDDAARQAIRGEVTPRSAVSRIVDDAYYASGTWDARTRMTAGDALDLGELVGIYWMYDEVDQPWSPSLEQIDRDALDALRALLERRDAARPSPHG